MSFRNRIRLPFYLKQPQFPIERNVFRKANGERKTLSAIVSNTYLGTTDYLPEDWHRKLAIALSHDFVQIENERYLTEVVLDSEYSIEWPEFRNYPIAPAKFTIQVTPFNASNSNCQTCEAASQISLSDDTFPDPLNEGDTGIFADLTANDSICCYPFTITLVSYNTTYLDSAEINEDGQLTIEIKDSVVSATNILVATYMVTCADGSYDEANVYADFTGTSEGCSPPSELVFSSITDTTTTASWTTSGAPNYIWNLYNPSDPATPLQTGSTSGLFVNLTGLVTGFTYLFEVYSDCGAYDYSPAIQEEFTTTGVNESCGTFELFHNQGDTGVAHFSYMSCAGTNVNDTIIKGGHKLFCAMIVEPGTPYFFVIDIWDYELNYNGEC